MCCNKILTALTAPLTAKKRWYKPNYSTYSTFPKLIKAQGEYRTHRGTYIHPVLPEHHDSKKLYEVAVSAVYEKVTETIRKG